MFKKTADLVEGGTPISTLVGQRDWAMAIVWFLVLWRLASSLALNIHRGQPSHRVGEKDISLKILPELQAPPSNSSSIITMHLIQAPAPRHCIAQSTEWAVWQVEAVEV